jgi:hypothetical protein
MTTYRKPTTKTNNQQEDRASLEQHHNIRPRRRGRTARPGARYLYVFLELSCLASSDKANTQLAAGRELCPRAREGARFIS